MNDAEGFELKGADGPGRRTASADEPHPRAVGSPLPMGNASPLSQAQGDAQRLTAGPPPPGRALANSPASGGPALELPSSLRKAVNAIRAALPFVQRILPLLDGNIGTAVSNIMAPHPHTPPPPPVNLVPLEEGLTELQTQHRELRDQVVEQNSSLKRVEDQLDLVREATDRNTLEQQELLEDLKGVGNKVNRFALIAFILLAISVLLNLILYLHIKSVLP